MIQIYRVPSECGPSNLVVLELLQQHIVFLDTSLLVEVENGHSK